MSGNRRRLFQSFVDSRLPTKSSNHRHLSSTVDASLLTSEEYIPRPLAYMRAASIIHLGTIAEVVTVPIHSPSLLIVKANCIDSKLGQCVKLVWLRDAVVI